MKYYFYPLLQELKQIYEEGGIEIVKTGEEHIFLPLIVSCSLDLPAKAHVQEMIGHNGYYGCGYCFHPGDLVKSAKSSVVRFIRRENVALRTNREMLKAYQIPNNLTMKGVKSISCMFGAIDFDLVNGFSIDYMHCVLLGVMRKLFDLWFETRNQPYSIPKQK